MLRPAFRAVRLVFGRHQRGFELPDHARPVVVAGPNGSGKSTLVEGVVRTLFGYEKRRSAETAELEARRPWDGAATRGEVTIAVGGESLRVSRDFATDGVRVEADADGVVHFEGDGKPGASNQEARHYRRILTDLFGVPDLDVYQGTLYIRQGDLPATRVGDHLLRLAAGGHARVDGARRDIAEGHRAVTRRPLHSAARAAINPRELEKVEEEIATLRGRLEAAREAGEQRGPLALERDRAAERLATLDDEIRRLEEARAGLAEIATLEIETRHARDLARRLDRASDRLRAATDEHAAAEAAVRDALRHGRYPADFPERLTAAELRWRDLAALRAGPGRWAGITVLVAGAAAAALWFLAGQPTAAIAAAALAGLALAAWLVLHFDARRRERAARNEIAAMLADVPDAPAITPETGARHAARFRGQRDAEARLREARGDLASAARDARGLLGEANDRKAVPSPQRGDDQRGRRSGSRIQRLLAHATTAAARARDRQTAMRGRLDRLGEASLRLPDAVPPTEEGVAAALSRRRSERARLQGELHELGQKLLERGTPAESLAALEAALGDLVPLRETLHQKARVFEAAHALVTDAYDAFRERDQERLLELVSAHAAALAPGAGPFVIRGTLEDTAVRVDGRTLPLESPPLSFGELHALLLAVRLGAADFLAGVGILPPLVVDEPFAHLDADHAAAVWQNLCAVAADRQVVVTTQDALLLDRLGIAPDLYLDPDPATGP
jgi:hypothetical protein